MPPNVTVKKRASIKKTAVEFGLAQAEILSAREIVNRARKGVDVALFYYFTKSLGWSEKDLAHILNTSPKTFQNYRALSKSLEPIIAEHLLKLIHLFKKGERTFGNKADFNKWLATAYWNGTGQPINWLNTPGGVDIVNEELDNILGGNPL